MATVAEAAKHLFISERRFYELLDRDVIARAKGGYELDDVRRQYIEHLRATAAGHGTEPGKLKIDEQRARKAKEEADRLEMANATMRGELLPRHDVDMAVKAAFGRVRSKLLGLPTKVAPLVVGMKSAAVVKEKISDAVYQALRELAATEIAGAAVAGDIGAGDAGADDPGSADPDRGAGLVVRAGAAAEPDGEPVGRPRAGAQRRGKRRAG